MGTTPIQKQATHTNRWLWLLIVPLIVACVGWLFSQPVTLALGHGLDGHFVTGFHADEQTEQGAGRWTTPQATLNLPVAGRLGVLDLRGAVAPVVGHVQLALPHGEQVTLQPPTGAVQPIVRHYQLIMTVPGVWSPSSAIGFISADQAASATDQRALGMLLQTSSFVPLGQRALVPPLLLFLLIGIFSVGCMLLLWLATKRLPVAAGGAALAGSLVAALWGWQRLWVTPYLWPLVIGVGWLLLPLMLARLRFPREVAPAALIGVLVSEAIGIVLWGFWSYHWAELWSWHGLQLIFWPLGIVLIIGSARWQRMGLVALVVVALVFAVANYANLWSRDWATDFAALFRGPRRFWNGEPLYEMAAIASNPFGNSYKYPPFFVFIMTPFTWLSPAPAFQSWKAFQLACLLGAGVCVWRAEGRGWRTWSLLWLGLVLAMFQPLIDTLRYGQIDALLLLILAAGYWAARRERWATLGVLLALATVIKLYPVYLLLLPIIWRKWRAVGGFVAGGLVMTVVSVLVLGWDVHLQFVRDVLPISGGGTAWVENQTINGFLNRLDASAQIGLQPAYNSTVQWLTYAAAVGLTALALWWARNLPLSRGYSLLIITMLVILPASWMHYETLLVIPIFLLFCDIERAGGLRWNRVVPLALAWAILCFGNQWTFFDKTLHGPFWQLILSYKLYGLLILGGVVGWPSFATRPVLLGQRELVRAPQP